ncbi:MULTISPECIES: FAD:protein FMN transferase [unclassified Pseudomonas]|uniref:FAD:protein FMN transferase n=1 Tax=unclassified Pseudomonas TaxID=196821 RepID=UPI000C8789EF|nr:MULTISPECIES: FAD:protein FMN transferase [unclassified Pseudomonas]PMU08556.1 thiamine biosynthesis protein ApbE [Pseudomonas sp. FW305-20]PMU19326.1 thiamine biosynthesis protein ApbE [Pseudomonas sp. FW305-122]PMU36487.1 thiamine biosynthesis protein ApbE [Pseudomonas sp. FW305-47B]PMX60943.1 thiamine biosynthesis protein ApbE [Pseudomonas sp. FW305-33]PMX65884.1 thiamine biosynthesis protein ApbE [Pseudomonas sp. FW305-60]
MLAGVLSGCGNGDSLERFDGPTMGSRYSIQYVRHSSTPGLKTVQAEVENILAEVDRQFSTYRSDSVIERFNALPAGRCQVMPGPVLELIRVGEQLSSQSEGSYDLTVEPLLNLWGFGPQGREEKIPTAEVLAEVRQRVGHAHLRIDGDQLCKDAAVEVDFNSIAAGYAVDAIAAKLEAMGIHNYLAEATGELKAAGKKLDGSPWRVALEEPRDDQRVAERIIAVDGYGVSTSGDYRNYFERDGRRYSHTFDARTGAPVLHTLASVTVIHPSALMADGLSTLLLILGPERGWDYAETHDIGAFFVIRADTGFVTRTTQAFERLSGGITE